MFGLVFHFLYLCDMCLTKPSLLSLTHESCPVQSSAILFIKGIDVGSFSEEKVYHLTNKQKGHEKEILEGGVRNRMCERAGLFITAL